MTRGTAIVGLLMGTHPRAREEMAMRIAVDHWENIISGKDSLESGTEPCILCDVYARELQGALDVSEVCLDCPLFLEGHGCNKKGSVWRKYKEEFEILKDLKESSVFMWEDLPDKCREDLLKAAKNMRDLLIKVRKEMG